jgi:hypothetical protein
MNNIEHLYSQRRRMMTGFMVAFTCWQIPSLIEDYRTSPLPASAETVLNIFTVVGALLFAYFVFRLARVKRNIKADPEVMRALQDERSRDIQLQAMKVGFVVTFLATTVFRFITLAWGLPVEAVLQTILVTAVVSTSLTYLYLDRD